MGQQRGPEAMATMKHDELAVQAGVDVDAGAGIATAAGTRVELQQAAVQRDGVVVADRALVLEAADALEVGRRGLPGGLRMGGRPRETRVVAWEESIEHALRLREGTSVREAQFGHQAILKRAEEALDPPPALGRGGGDPVDTEFLERAADLGRGDGAGQLVGQRRWEAGIAMKQAVAIGVHCRRDAVALDETVEEHEVALGVFLGAKDPGQHVPCRIIDGGVQHKTRAAGLQPGMVTAVHLDEEAGLRHALSAPAMPGRAAVTGAADSGGAEPALHRGTRHVQLLPFLDELREVTIVAAGVRGAGQGKEPLAHRVRQPSGRGPTAVAMGEGGQAVLADRGEQALELPSRQAHELGRIRHREMPLEELDQDVGSLLLSRAQGDSPPVHAARVTESLSS